LPTVALLWGIAAFVAFAIGLIPCLGWLNWIGVPFGAIGVVLGIVAMGRARGAGQPPGAAIAGLVLSAVAACLGLFRLVLGGGIL
jgi:hypothetical protein